ncbi:MAG: 3'-to-5' oligoribonuclease B [Campylobacteraceae bacterium]|jgi:oligoribonuclease NrnB/cAMP/cGMP phosphodiesterase (DHH superfamily)|nr:3'-to-5' oligoribonuclease B [Campylobacteraceae bacterium]
MNTTQYTVFHLSHTDLDGYGSQFITKNYFQNIRFYNSNYGKEIDERYAQILADIQNVKAEKSVILITDLNLTPEQAKNFEERLKNVKSSVKLILLDHHQSADECAKKYPWYFLDSSRCAAKITYDFFSKIYGEKKRLGRLSEVINAVDIWLEDSADFELGKVCLNLISNAKELNRIMFDDANTQYMFCLLQNVIKYTDKKEPHILLDDDTHSIKKSFFQNGGNDTLGNLVSKYNVEQLGKMKDKMTVFYKGYKAILTFNIGAVSVIGNNFLTQNPDYDFFMDVTSRKTVSFRANGKTNVSKIAFELANGGGHPNASGGTIAGFRDSFLYENVKNQIINLLKSKEEST